ncbi:hypothetical protein GTO27_05525 [Candidatus Bathyarchaeota archaeon]|nr:hypothetical protein [Candidatus Bathyarchaeota archaeon]
MSLPYVMNRLNVAAPNQINRPTRRIAVEYLRIRVNSFSMVGRAVKDVYLHLEAARSESLEENEERIEEVHQVYWE